MSSKHKLLINESQPIVRAGLRAVLGRERDLEVMGETDNNHDTLRMVGELLPDLVVVDFNVQHSSDLDTITRIRGDYPSTRVLVLTYQKNEESIRGALRAGANGYALKDASKMELITAVRSVLTGKLYLSPSISDQVINLLLVGESKSSRAKNSLNSLTQRELQVLKMIAKGSTNKHIAEHLSLSIKTIDKHRSNLMRKLDLHNVCALTTYAINNGLVTIP